MDFNETDEQLLMRKSVADLVKQFPNEYWRNKDGAGEFPGEFWDKMAAAGWFAVNIPTEYGGAGLGMYEAALVAYEVARSGGGVAAADLVMRTLAFAAQTIKDHGSLEAREKYLPKLARGQLLCSFAHTEPNAGVNTFDIETYATKKGHSYYLNGQKIWITLAHRADLMVLVARTTPKEKAARKSEGLTLFLLEPQRATVKTSRIPGAALRSLGSNMVFFENAEVPEANVLGQEDKGWSVLTGLLNAERISTAAISIGTGELVLEQAVEYAKNRKVFGRPIGSNQAIQFPLAHCKAELEAAKQVTQKAAWLFDRKRDCALEANIAAYLGARAAFSAADRAVQTLGGMGFAQEYDVERHWRDLRLFRTAPVPEEMVLNYLGHHVLGLPRSF